MGATHFTHAAAINQRENFVRTESSAGLERHAITERIIELNHETGHSYRHHRRFRAGVSLALRHQRCTLRRGDRSQNPSRNPLDTHSYVGGARRNVSRALGWAGRVARESVQELRRHVARNHVRADARLAVRRHLRGLSICSGRVCAPRPEHCRCRFRRERLRLVTLCRHATLLCPSKQTSKRSLGLG